LHSYLTTDSKTSMSMICVTLKMPSASEECQEPSGNCQGFQIVWRVVTLNIRGINYSRVANSLLLVGECVEGFLSSDFLKFLKSKLQFDAL